MSPRWRRILTTATATALLAAAPASGQQGGVFVDPDSPSGKEYQLPLESVRRGADPQRAGDEKVQSGDQSSALFGVGIGDDDDGERGGAGDGRRGSSGSGNGTRKATAPAEEGADDVLRTAAARPGAPADDAGTLLIVGGGALLVLAAGAGIGVVLRRRSGSA